MTIEGIICFEYIAANGNEYRRNNGSWEQRMGESWEPVFYPIETELEKRFQALEAKSDQGQTRWEVPIP